MKTRNFTKSISLLLLLVFAGSLKAQTEFAPVGACTYSLFVVVVGLVKECRGAPLLVSVVGADCEAVVVSVGNTATKCVRQLESTWYRCLIACTRCGAGECGFGIHIVSQRVCGSKS